MARITEDMKVGMQGIVPSTIITCSKEGVPNISYISQVYYVDDDHVALSHQFFNKSVRNFLENPQVCACIVHPMDGRMWKLDLRYSHSETDSELYENMSAQLEAIASMTGMEGVFHLKAAEVFNLLNIELIGGHH